MNILMINTTNAGGGAASICAGLAYALEAEGHSVSFFAADIRANGHAAIVIPRQFWRKLLGFVLGTERLISTDWILSTPQFKSADIIHCHNLHGRYFNLETLQKMSLVKPVIWTLHDEWAITPHCANTMQSSEMKNGLYVCPSIDTPPRLLWDNSKRLARWKLGLYKKSHMTLTIPSLWLTRRVEKTILGEQTLHHIPNGIATDVFVRTNQAEARAALNLPLGRKIVLILADDAVKNPWKGWQYTKECIDAYEDQGDVLFLSVGNHTEHADGPNITYRGYISDPAEVALYYSAADTFLFTSLAENFPLAVLEAASCGLPIVAFNVGGVPEIVSHLENGYVVRYRDSNDLAVGLAWALALSQEECELVASQSAEAIRAQYDLKHMIAAYKKLYQSLILTP